MPRRATRGARRLGTRTQTEQSVADALSSTTEDFKRVQNSISGPGTDSVKIGQGDAEPAIAQERFARLVKRTIDGHELNGECEELPGKERALVKCMARSSEPTRIFNNYVDRLEIHEQEPLKRAVASANSNAVNPYAVATMAELIEASSQIKWLWRGWIPYGLLSMVIGLPGICKSAFVLGVIVRSIIQAKSWPTGQRGPKERHRVVWIDTEGSSAITANRVKEWKLPSKRILLSSRDVFGGIRLDAAEEISRLQEVIRIEKPHVVVIDALRSAHGKDENSSNVESVVRPLALLAQETNVAVVVVHHSRKEPDGQEIDASSARGSNALVAIARSVIAIDQPDPRSELRRVRVVKSNVSQPPPPIGFKMTSKGLYFAEAPSVPRKKKQIDLAKELLNRELAGGRRRKQKELQASAEAKGIKYSTLRRAKKDLSVDAKKEGREWTWGPTANRCASAWS